jgi:hypothetical protein
MSKTGFGLFLVLVFFAATASAQKTDTTKKDTTKIDTNLINRYRIEPHKNTIPLRFRPVQIQREEIPISMRDYKVSYWHKAIVFGLNFSQSAFSNNYAAGGVNAVALGTNFDFKAEYNKAPFDYTVGLNLIYGISKNKGQGSRKTNDRIFLDNKIATQLSKHWFDKGFNYSNPDGTLAQPPLLISKFMSPGYLTESIGFEYKPVKYFDLRIGTGTARQTFVLDTTIYHNISGNYGVAPGHTVKNDLAMQVVAAIDKDLMKNLHLNARYALFIPYGRPAAFISHRFDAVLSARVNRLIAVTINSTFLYDKTTAKGIQGTEGLALGVIYKFP